MFHQHRAMRSSDPLPRRPYSTLAYRAARQLLRRAVLRGLRPYAHHQEELDEKILDALERKDEQLEQLEDLTRELILTVEELRRANAPVESPSTTGTEAHASIEAPFTADTSPAKRAHRAHAQLEREPRIVTIATPTSLPQARVLVDSITRVHPTWAPEIVLVAAEPPDDEQDRVRLVTDLLDVDLRSLVATFYGRELETILVPHVLHAYCERHREPVLHLPASAWVLDDLQPLLAELRASGVLLVPRARDELPDDGLQPSQSDLERNGRLCETAIGVDGGTERAGEFLAWWIARVELTLGALDGSRRGARPEDRHWLGGWLELAAARFSAAVIEDPGCNASLWNLHRHSLSSTAEGVLVDGHTPLRFLDLPGFQPGHPYRLAANASRVRVSRSTVLRELCSTYAALLERAGWRLVNDSGKIGRRLPNGLVYDDALRRLHDNATMLGARFGDLFSEQGADAFTRWLEGPAPHGAAHGITRYLFFRVRGERPDVSIAYPDLDGQDGPGYVSWCQTFGQDELAIPDCFMPRAQPEAIAADALGAQVDPECEPSTNGGAVGVGAQTSEGSAGEPEGSKDDPRRIDSRARIAVRVSGYLGHTLGLGSAARGYVEALKTAGVQTSSLSVPLHHDELSTRLGDGYGRHSFDDHAHEDGHQVELVAVNPDELPAFVERVGEDHFHGRRIGIWGWETNSIPSRWKRAFAWVDEIWVYSSFMAENIGSATPRPVIALPPPVKAPQQSPSPTRLGVPEGFLFLFVFDYLSTIQRKNPVGLIEAFKRAFAPNDGPRLLIKTINAPLRPLAEEALLWAAHGRDEIHVVDCSLSGAERDGLMAACDCYVSLHRAEGFGLTMAEAMAIGKPVIATGYSGNIDFMNAENSFLIDYELCRVGPDCEIYPADGEWAQPSVEHAAALMREVHEDPQRAARAGARAREDVARMLSPESTGAAMRARLEQLRDGGPSASHGLSASRVSRSPARRSA